MWVAPFSIMERTEVRTPRTAPISWPFASCAAGTAKKYRNNSYVPSIRYTSMRVPSALASDVIRTPGHVLTHDERYSVRRAFMGEMDAARRAGMMAAKNAAIASADAAMLRASGSQLDTP